MFNSLFFNNLAGFSQLLLEGNQSFLFFKKKGFFFFLPLSGTKN